MANVTKQAKGGLRKKSVVVFITIAVIFINIPPGYSLFLQFVDKDLFRYSNCNGTVTFQEIPFKSRDFTIAKDIYNTYNDSMHIEGCNLYRLYKINPLAIWRWGHYLFDERYRLPYKNWNEIEQIRGKIDNKSGFQDF